jgi:hypothetical protein
VSAAETTYSARIAYPDYLVRGRAQQVSLELYRSGALAAPSSGSFALYSPSGEVVISSSAVTVTADIATYNVAALDLPSTKALGHGYYEIWELVCADGVTRSYRRDAALVLYAAYPVVTDADLEAVYSDLSEDEDADFTSYDAKLDEAWKRILGRLEMQGVFPEHVVTSWSLREVHIELTLHLICLDFARAQGGRWMELSDAHKREFELAWKRMKFTKGRGENGAADSDDLHSASPGVVLQNASPRATWRGMGGL